MSELLAVVPDEIETAAREEHFGDIGRDPVRIKCRAVAIDMLREAIAITPTRGAAPKSS